MLWCQKVHSMKLKSHFFLGFLATVALNPFLLTTEVKAQKQNQFEQNFINNLVKGCKANTQNSPSTASKQHSFCICYAKSFVKRYSNEELALILKSLPSNPKEVRNITRAFMMPEIKSCR